VTTHLVELLDGDGYTVCCDLPSWELAARGDRCTWLFPSEVDCDGQPALPGTLEADLVELRAARDAAAQHLLGALLELLRKLSTPPWRR
jgi:hypothetical protein